MSKPYQYVIIGLGKTGFATAKYLAKRKIAFAVNDSRQQPPYLAEFQQQFPDVPVSLGGFDDELMQQADTLMVSPGVPIATKAIQQAKANGVQIIGDIELFIHFAQAPVVAVTGTNGKSTVVSLLGVMAEIAGHKAIVAGNIGTCVLDILEQPVPEVYILELSSFQLETTQSLSAKVATILNITPDHMDRYSSFDDYADSKRKIYRNAEFVVYNADDPLTAPTEQDAAHTRNFTVGNPEPGQYGLKQDSQGNYFLYHGDKMLINAKDMRIAGIVNYTNALCAFAIGECLGWSQKAMANGLRHFAGLSHRLQWVRRLHDVDWYNDSKGTNVGASVQAISGLGSTRQHGKLILIAGGEGKDADFSPLAGVVQQYCRDVILIGQDSPIIAAALNNTVPLHHMSSLEDAVKQAQNLASPGDTVVLSPACASFDMFQNFEHRGECYVTVVNTLE